MTREPPLPVKLCSTTNGEHLPAPPPPWLHRVQAAARSRAAEHARRLGTSRRAFLRSACGVATVLGALNLAGCAGGRFAVGDDEQLDEDAARAALHGDELVFDVQTHHVAAERPWYAADTPNLGDFLRDLPTADCGGDHWVECYARDPYLKEVFLDSDTHIACLSALWGGRRANPLHAEEAARTRERVAELGRGRLRIHGIVEPRASGYGPLEEHMQGLVDEWRVDAWKLYPVWGPDGRGYELTDPVGRRTLRTGLALGRPVFAVHKGLPLPGMEPGHASALDVGPAAREHPAATLLVYHSGYHPEQREGPYDPRAERGVDSLVRGCRDAGIGPDGNVYAELGTLWRELMKRPDEAAHALGKLLAQLGEDRILWGTDSIWYGSPQDQIQAFRAFEITPEFQERFGYPALTPAAKRKILGENAARVYGVDAAERRAALADDRLARARSRYAEVARPSFRTYGPRTRRELFKLLDLHGGPGHG